jgi:hypothetical protein
MIRFAIIEMPDGLTVKELLPGQSPEDAAASQGGVLIDPGPFASYEEANDALVALEAEDGQERARPDSVELRPPRGGRGEQDSPD